MVSTRYQRIYCSIWFSNKFTSFKILKYCLFLSFFNFFKIQTILNWNSSLFKHIFYKRVSWIQMLNEFFICINNSKWTKRRLFSMMLIPIVNLTSQEKIIVLNFSSKWVRWYDKHSISIIMRIMKSHMFINCWFPT